MTEEGNLDFILSDTEAAVRAMLNRSNKSSLCPRLVFKHQIYEIVHNKNEIESDLDLLREQNRIRIFEQIPAPNSSSMLVGVMLTEHYIDDVHKMATHLQQSMQLDEAASSESISRSDVNSSTQQDDNARPRKKSRILSNSSSDAESESSALLKFSKWLATHNNISVLENDLLLPFIPEMERTRRLTQPTLSSHVTGSPDTEEEQEKENESESSQIRLTLPEIQAIRKCGFLQQRVGGSSFSSDGGIYALAHPRAGLLASALSSAQSYLLQRIRMTRYKELSEKKIITEIRSEAKQRITSGEVSSQHVDGNSAASANGRRAESVECSRKFPLGLRFHVSDLVGRRVLTRVVAPSLSLSTAATHGGFTGILRLGPAAAPKAGSS